MKLDYFCKACGSRNVFRDATARWDVNAQAWVLAGVCDHSTCGECGRESILKEFSFPEVKP